MQEALGELSELIEAKKYKETVELGRELVKRYPDSFQIKFSFGRILGTLKRYEEAETILLELNRKYPDNIRLLLEMAGLYCSQSKDSEALDCFQKVLFLDSENEEALKGCRRLQAFDETAEVDPVGAGISPPVVDRQVSPTNSVDDHLRELGYVEQKTQPPKEDTEAVVGEGQNPGVEPSQELKETETGNESAIIPPAEVEKNEVKSREADFSIAEEFQTESAAQVYFKQGLFHEAIQIYENLFKRTGEVIYREKAGEIREKMEEETVIQRLNSLLDGIKDRGPADV